jgi:putative transposase
LCLDNPTLTQDHRGGHRLACLRQTLDGRSGRPVSGLLHHAVGHDPWRARPDSKRAVEDRALLSDIRQVHANSAGRYGSPRVHATLRANGRKVGRGRVERLMRRHGVRGLVAPRRRVQTTDSRHAFPVAPNLLDRKFTAAAPNQIWLADLTYIATGEGWLYMAAVMDLHTRKGSVANAGGRRANL